MDSLNTIAYSVLEAIRREISDDEFISLRLIKDDIIDLRYTLLRNELDKNGRFASQNIVQDLGCVGLEYADPADCCDVSTDCKVLRTNVEIPEPIYRRTKDSITRVGPVNKTLKPFNYIPYERVPYVLNTRFSFREIFSFMLNNRIYILSENKANLLLDKINIRGVFADPREAVNFTDCDGVDCYTDNSEFPIGKEMKETIEKELFQRYLNQSISPRDEENNSDSNLTPNYNAKR